MLIIEFASMDAARGWYESPEYQAILPIRLKASKDISTFRPEIQRIFRAMKRHGLIVADNGSDMYISGTMDARWDNDVLNPAFRSLTADDFEVIELGWRVNPPSVPTNLRVVRTP